MASYRSNNILKHIDWFTVIMYLGLCLFGWMNICGATYTGADEFGSFILTWNERACKQLIWILTSLLMGGIILLLDHKIYDTVAFVLYAAMILILIATRFMAKDTKGSLSWIDLGIVKIQPAEFAKLTTALAVAKYMGQYEYKFNSWRDLVMPFIIIGLPACIIMIWQKETGSALVFASFLLVFYRQGMSGYVLLCGVMAIILFIIAIRFGSTPLPLGSGCSGILTCMIILMVVGIVFTMLENKRRFEWLIISGVIAAVFGLSALLCIWFPINFNWVSIGTVIALGIYLIGGNLYYRRPKMVLVGAFILISIGYVNACNFVFTKVLQNHQRSRIEVLLGIKEDPHGVGYNVTQSRIAIGSGGLVGKGYLQGTQTKLEFVPEQATDFIFCTVGEEWGFLGTSMVLIAYLAFIMHLIRIAERQRNEFSKLYAYSIASIFLFHLTINIGMVIGVLPVIGIPLPFFSYGGSSLWGFSIMLFILLRLDAAQDEMIR